MTAEIIIHQAILFLHIIGATMVVGIWFANLKKERVMPGQLHAAYLMLVTGVILMLMNGADWGHIGGVNHMKVGIKFLITLVITAAAFLGNKAAKTDDIDTPEGAAKAKNFANIVGILGIVNIAIAVFWV